IRYRRIASEGLRNPLTAQSVVRQVLSVARNARTNNHAVDLRDRERTSVGERNVTNRSHCNRIVSSVTKPDLRVCEQWQVAGTDRRQSRSYTAIRIRDH